MLSTFNDQDLNIIIKKNNPKFYRIITFYTHGLSAPNNGEIKQFRGGGGNTGINSIEKQVENFSGESSRTHKQTPC